MANTEKNKAKLTPLVADQGNIIDGGDGDDFIAAVSGTDYLHFAISSVG